MEVKAKTARVKLTRTIFLNGQHSEAGEVHEIPIEIAEYLVACGSAELCGWQAVAKWFTRRTGAGPRFIAKP